MLQLVGTATRVIVIVIVVVIVGGRVRVRVRVRASEKDGGNKGEERKEDSEKCDENSNKDYT